MFYICVLAWNKYKYLLAITTLARACIERVLEQIRGYEELPHVWPCAILTRTASSVGVWLLYHVSLPTLDASTTDSYSATCQGGQSQTRIRDTRYIQNTTWLWSTLKYDSTLLGTRKRFNGKCVRKRLVWV